MYMRNVFIKKTDDDDAFTISMRPSLNIYMTILI